MSVASDGISPELCCLLFVSVADDVKVQVIDSPAEEEEAEDLKEARDLSGFCAACFYSNPPVSVQWKDNES